MSWWEQWKQRRALRRWMNEIQEGIWTCLEQPEQIPDVCRKLGIAESEMHGWLQEARTRLGKTQPTPKLELQTRPMPEILGPIRKKSRRVIFNRLPDAVLAEQVRRLIHLLLDLPMAKETPVLVRDFIVQLSRAAAYQNGEVVEALGVAILEAKRVWAMGAPSLIRAEVGGASGRYGAPDVFGAMNREQAEAKWLAANARRAMLEYIALDAVEAMDREQDTEAEGGRQQAAGVPEYLPLPESATKAEGGRQQAAGIPEGLLLPDGPDWEPVRPLLQTIYGNPEIKAYIEETVSYLDTLQTAIDQSSNAACAPDDLLLIIRRRLDRTTLELAEQSNLSRALIEQALSLVTKHAAVPFRHLRWSLEQGEPQEACSRNGRQFPQDVDVAWTLLSRLALGCLPYNLKGKGPKIEWIRQQGAAQREKVQRAMPPSLLKRPPIVTSALAPLLNQLFDIEDRMQRLLEAITWFVGFRTRRWVAALAERMSTPTGATHWLENVRWVLEGHRADVDPDLAVALAGELCQNQGTLSWEACLRLANGRAQYHRYLDAGEGVEKWKVVAEVRTRPDGVLEVPFAVVEQPLSPRFRQQFEAKNLEGRVKVLWHLVEYAKSFRASIHTFGVADVQQQITLREEELLQQIRDDESGGASSKR